MTEESVSYILHICHTTKNILLQREGANDIRFDSLAQMVDILKKEAVDFGFVCNLTNAITPEQFGKLSDISLLDEVVKPQRSSERDREQIGVLAGGKQQAYYNMDDITEEDLGRLADFLPATYVMPIFLQYLGFLKEEV